MLTEFPGKRRQVRLPGEMGVGRMETAEGRGGPWGEFQAEDLEPAHLGNALVFKEER